MSSFDARWPDADQRGEGQWSRPAWAGLFGLDRERGAESCSARSVEPFKEVSERAIKKVPALRGKTIVNLFFEASTRTRISFEFAEKRLSADTVNVAAVGSSVSKGETLVDTAKNLEAMRIDMVVIRHGAAGAAQFLGHEVRSKYHCGRRQHSTRPGLLDLPHPADLFNRSGLNVRSR